MGNVIESSTDILPGSLNHEESSSSDMPANDLYQALEPASEEKFSPNTNDENHTRDDKFTQRNATSLPVSPNTSFPLLESELPETFDASLDPADLSLYFANVDLESSDEGQKAFVPAQPTKIHQTTISDDCSSIELQSPRVQPSSISLTPASEIHLLDCGPHISRPSSARGRPDPGTMAEQFSQLEGTMADILSSPVPVYSAAIHQLMECPSVGTFQDDRSPAKCGVPQYSTGVSQSIESIDPVAETTLQISETLSLVTTYADATNLAMQYPALAEDILTYPLPQRSQTPVKVEEARDEQPPCPSLHHPDRPNWAAAPLPNKEGTPQSFSTTINREGRPIAHAPKQPSRSRRSHRRGSVQTLPNPYNSISEHRVPLRDGRHETPPHHEGAKERDQNPSLSGVPQLPELSQHWTNSPENSNNNRKNHSSQPLSWGPKHLSRDTLSGAASSGQSDVGAVDVVNQWYPFDVVKPSSNATSSQSDEPHLRGSSKSGAVRLGRHIISPRAIDDNHKPNARHAQAKQLAVVARRYLGESFERGSRGTLSSATPGRSSEIANIAGGQSSVISSLSSHRSIDVPGEGSEERFHNKFSSSCASLNQLTSSETYTEGQIRSSESPFREIKERTINVDPVPYIFSSPKLSTDLQIPHNHASTTKVHMSPAITSLQSQENHPIENFNQAENTWLPRQHTLKDWLSPIPSRLDHDAHSHSKILHPKPITSDTSNHPLAQHESGQHPFRLNDNYLDHTGTVNVMPSRQFTFLGTIGPVPDGQQPTEHSGRGRQSLPAQSDVFAQHLAVAHPFVGRGGGRSASAQYVSRGHSRGVKQPRGDSWRSVRPY